jgi:hypothetical protein
MITETALQLELPEYYLSWKSKEDNKTVSLS